ncbi:DUF4148 domain-containing protein [Burkholderia glumae]|uniref:DUF4148 domain-containing protein n=2 Tax=Burkholderia glumae TaxID=337 RepID=A0AAQ0BSG8_BURGL|nr:DUF4148 domain-containing protein [Burkholderia glumae]ACR30361.1 Hypothetical protein bglu_1g32990 [Burkholderia glumae BGR1]AJY66294.1 hypothetical protein KS03_760 [Burkholderia glumae LMG 2196 = ATCC 33617]KHJ63833.1 hypothetical protein NCPPB3923_06200 [Burkholderia glumae]MCM2481987.1 DUF4148 domain-containing protein [Burkholderia glumae]MCM2491415.1 DUF4148 domain-containing protein [Burkholderia glumae]
MKPAKTLKHAVLCAGLMAAGLAANAAPLTPQQCGDYPFVKSSAPVTHRQIVNELSELESVGYQPSAGDDSSYPDDYDTAEQKLMRKYRRDCLARHTAAADTGAPGAPRVQ